jgi:hypothetical protein
MQPWINAQAPRLRLTDDACPDVANPTTDACYAAPAAAEGAGGKARGGRVCASGKKTYPGVRDHRERPYIAALLACARPVGLSDRCVAALQ